MKKIAHYLMSKYKSINILNLILLILVSSITFESCKNLSFHKIKDEAVSDTSFNLSILSDDLNKDLKCYDIQKDRICCPENWKPINQNKLLFLSQLADSSANTYFSVTKLDKDISGLNLEAYLKQAYKLIKNDSTDFLVNCKFQKIIFKNNKAIKGEILTKHNGIEYVTYTMFVEWNGLLYDFKLKIDRNGSAEYEKMFNNILLNFQANNEFIYFNSSAVNKLEDIVVD